MADKKRCDWCLSSEKMIHYHDHEWGVPVHDDKKLFEFIVLDTFQAGLSWSTVLNKRENFSKAFAEFDAGKIAKFNEAKIEKLLLDPGIIRNRLKVFATVSNAKSFLKIQEEEGSFDAFIWKFTNGKPLVNLRKSMKDIPASSVHSDEMSKELKKRGFKFVGTTICYAFMQAAGMVNDHLTDCFRYPEIKKIK
jgi:DNA-3-methyladenine glycosylase I